MLLPLAFAGNALRLGARPCRTGGGCELRLYSKQPPGFSSLSAWAWGHT